MTLDLPLALAVHRRLGEEEQSIHWLKQGIEWSWQYQGHWAKTEVYESKAYERLLQQISIQPIVEQMRSSWSWNSDALRRRKVQNWSKQNIA